MRAGHTCCEVSRWVAESSVVCKVSGLATRADFEHWQASDLKPYLEQVVGCFGWDRVMFSTDYPHWDFDLPSVIYDLPFLSEKGKRNILGANAERFFGRKFPLAKKIPKIAD